MRTLSFRRAGAAPRVRQLEALNVGSIDFGDVGEAPPIFAQAASAPLAYVAPTVPRPASEAVLVRRGSTARSVADLKGRKVALNKGSNVHFLLVRLLAQAGLAYGDVQPVFLPPADARAAARNADVVKILVEEIDKVDAWGAAHRGELAAEFSQLWGIPRPIVDVAVGRAAYGTGPITRAILAEQQQIADVFHGLGLIPRRINLQDAAVQARA